MHRTWASLWQGRPGGPRGWSGWTGQGRRTRPTPPIGRRAQVAQHRSLCRRSLRDPAPTGELLLPSKFGSSACLIADAAIAIKCPQKWSASVGDRGNIQALASAQTAGMTAGRTLFQGANCPEGPH